MTHACHANGCEATDVHAEVPFCKKHWEMLPEPHQKKIWRGRTQGMCGVCEAFDEPENVLAPGPVEKPSEWDEFVHLGIALLCYLEYGDHDCPKELMDEDGFCWGCGVNDAEAHYQQAKAIVKKYKLKKRA